METSNSLMSLYKSCYIKLGGSSINVEIGEDDYHTAFDEALRLYRARSRRSVEEGWLLVELYEGQNEYYLPSDIDNVRDIRRLRATFFMGGAGFEPFSAAFINSMLMKPHSGTPQLAQYELLTQYHELLGRMFGEHFLYYFNEGTSKITLWRNIRNGERVGMDVSRLRSIQELMNDGQSYRWLQDYTLASVKCILGEKYRKVAILPGPQSGTNLKGGDLVADGTAEKEALEQELLEYGDNGYGPDPFFG